MKIQKKSPLYLTLFRMLVIDWPDKISGISYKRVVVVTVVSCFNFAGAFCFFATSWPDASGDLGKLDCTQYVGDNDICIDHLQHTEAEVIVEEMGAFEEDGAVLITVMMQMQPFRNYYNYWSAPLDDRVFCSCRHAYFINGGYGCVSLE